MYFIDIKLELSVFSNVQTNVHDSILKNPTVKLQCKIELMRKSLQIYKDMHRNLK